MALSCLSFESKSTCSSSCRTVEVAAVGEAAVSCLGVSSTGEKSFHCYASRACYSAEPSQHHAVFLVEFGDGS